MSEDSGPPTIRAIRAKLDSELNRQALLGMSDFDSSVYIHYTYAVNKNRVPIDKLDQCSLDIGEYCIEDSILEPEIIIEEGEEIILDPDSNPEDWIEIKERESA